MARASFLPRGVEHYRTSRVSNAYDRGARFKTRKTKTNMAARGFFHARSLLYCWRRNSHTKEALPARTTSVNSVYLRKIVSGIQCFPNFKGNSIDRDSHRERIKDSQNRICVKILQSKPRRLSLTTTTTVNEVLAANKTKRLFGARSPAPAHETVSGSQNSS